MKESWIFFLLPECFYIVVGHFQLGYYRGSLYASLVATWQEEPGLPLQMLQTQLNLRQPQVVCHQASPTCICGEGEIPVAHLDPGSLVKL